MGLIFGFLVVLAAIGGLVYTLVIHREVPGVMEQRFGVLEPLPADVGQWKTDDDSDEGKAAAREGLRREVRLFYDPNRGFWGSGKLVRQVRYRNSATNAVVRVEQSVPVRRRRLTG
jgi:hypothetical protein